MLTVVVCHKSKTYAIKDLSSQEKQNLPAGWELYDGGEDRAIREGYQKRVTPDAIFRIPSEEHLKRCSL